MTELAKFSRSWCQSHGLFEWVFNLLPITSMFRRRILTYSK